MEAASKNIQINNRIDQFLAEGVNISGDIESIRAQLAELIHFVDLSRVNEVRIHGSELSDIYNMCQVLQGEIEKATRKNTLSK
ncbi:hypothetical protein HOD30_00265 [Candidatus Peregrinibacteria bacterium]|jgi:hypothetical protein|nr:hypothetical protein [Candidatus Peregrinibacteria bacterium]MBT4631352.1 hypothetical protein [Candidatus Peregrinibacteria bacterium]MBT5517191.1 hypothetical protein [Candidatus Peregrinibacteria bacterium]MBT5823773.1 hypothetical protein [Candidatus Peregrinibacteria bacterium]